MLRRLLFPFILLLCYAALPAQEVPAVGPALKFKNISLGEGLSQSSVLCILQDREGFLWFGTRNGLNKYDGNTFTTYRYDARDSNSVSNSYIKSLAQDYRGNLWVGTRNGLNRYDPERDAFQRYLHPATRGTELQDEIWSLVADGDRLWVGSGFGLGRMELENGELTYYTHDPKDDSSLSSDLIRDLEMTTDALWVKTVRGVDRFDPEQQTFRHYTLPGEPSRDLSATPPPALYEDSQHRLWLGYADGLAIFREETERFELYELPSGGAAAITKDVRSIYEDDYGSLWVGTYAGLYVLDPDRGTVAHLTHDENDPNSLSQNSIYAIYGDSRGDIWIGTYAGGINYYNRSFDLFQHFAPGTNASKLNYKVVSCIVQDPRGDLWIGTEGGGINVYDRATGEFTYYTHDGEDPGSLSSNNVKAMIRDRAGNFWIGTHDGGLNFLNPRKLPLTFYHYRSVAADPTTLSNDRVIALHEDRDGNIWVGTSGGGLNVLDPATGTVSRIAESGSRIGQIIFTISATPDPATLLVGGDRTLAEVDLHSQKITPIAFRDVEDESPVISTYRTPDGNLWIGTEGSGLYHYDVSTRQSTRYGTGDGLPNDVIYGILPDDGGNLWLSTVHGLSRMNPETRSFRNFDASDGLQSNEFNYGAYLKTESGELIFGGVNGLTVFQPGRITENPFIPPVSITTLSINNQPLNRKLLTEEPLVLTHDQNVLEFDFVALSYSQPTKNQYAYKLEGFDKDWNYVGNRKSATYTNLDAGDYVFRVKASNNDGLWNEEGKAVAFTIRPAPWRTWWAYSLYGCVLVGGLLLLRRNAIQRINDKNQLRQERLDKERLEEVNRMKLELFTNICHDFRTPLTLIAGPLERMLKSDEGSPFMRRQLGTMYRNTSVLMQLINQLLDFRKAEAGKLELEAAAGDIVAFAEEVKLGFEELAISRNIEYLLIAPPERITVWFDPVMLRKVLYNLLSNAFKFTPDGGRVTIEIAEKKSGDTGAGDLVKIIVSDTGRGIPKENIAHIFERFFQFGERFGTGIGLPLAKSLVELHRGTIKVKSTEKKGTRFVLSLPLGRAHLRPEECINDRQTLTEHDLYSVTNDAYGSLPLPVNAGTEQTGVAPYDKSLPSILLVEDNDDVRTFIRGIFQDTYNIFEAAEGRAGIEVARTSAIDVIISDVMMPVMDGMELCREIKSNVRTSHIPVILLTARTAPEQQHSGYRTGADAYITKPFDAEILELRVNNLLKSRRDLIDKFKKDLILQPAEVTTTCADEEFLQRAISIVEAHMTEADFSVQVLIREMNMSRSALYRKLKSLTDQSPTEFVRVIKLKRAAQLMVSTDMTISQIAFELGFNDKKYFRKEFKQHFRMVPSKYRAEHTSLSQDG